ncbi:MAG: polymerase, sigma-24 subunit, subfamily [Conexibacter sp.]|jgi:RNA polymerase sigma-70 factor (ECF subfamily)|nr:polymerase, sigma-24 subunit, subfamily [Conexibacter sp.]
MSSLSASTDHRLLDACRSGDVDAFGIFYARHREALLGFLVRRVGDPEAGVDLMAEAFATALEVTLDRTKPLPPAPVAWLFLVAKNLLIDSVRRGKVEAAARQRLGLEPLVLDDADIERVAEIAAAGDLTEQMIDVLSETEWEAFQAHVVDEEPYPNMAQRLSCSEAVLRKRVSRAKSRLRTAIGGIDV